MSTHPAHAEVAIPRGSAKDALGRSLRAIDDRERSLRAWAYLDRDLAHAAAAAVDEDDAELALRGMTIGVKDVFDTFDQPTGLGSPIYRSRTPDRDASAVAMLRGAGAVVVGKTVTAEFAWSAPGPTTNPHDERRTPGGSSSGSAAAVAAGMITVGLGTQTAGSIIRPAGFCGVIGYKPTFGTVSRSGVLECAASLDTVGVLAATVPDAAAAVAVMARRPDLATIDTPAAPPRVLALRPAERDGAQASTIRAVVQAAAAAKQAGAMVTTVDVPDWYATAREDQRVIMAAETAVGLAHERRRHWPRLSEQLRALIAEGEGYSPDRIAIARGRRGEYGQALARIFDDFDVVLAAATQGEAPVGLSSTGDPGFAAVWTLLGVPTICVPFGRGEAGMPVGVQVIARLGNDRYLLSFGRWLAALGPQPTNPVRS